jgi:hypothetical protein
MLFPLNHHGRRVARALVPAVLESSKRLLSKRAVGIAGSLRSFPLSSPYSHRTTRTRRNGGMPDVNRLVRCKACTTVSARLIPDSKTTRLFCPRGYSAYLGRSRIPTRCDQLLSILGRDPKGVERLPSLYSSITGTYLGSVRAAIYAARAG